MTVHQSSPLLLPPQGALALGEVSSALWFSLVIPTYNERRTLPNLLEQLIPQLEQHLPGAYEVIVVDDNSGDRTWQIATELTAQYPQLRVMRRQQEQGLASAVVRGWQVARGQVLGVMDADFQHPPSLLPALLEALDQGADLALATRYGLGGSVSHWSFGRRLLSRGAQSLGMLLLPGIVGRVSDPMSGYFLVRRSAIAGPRFYPLSYKILLEVLGRGRVNRIAEVGYGFGDRMAGCSKVGWRQYRDYLLHLLCLRWALRPWCSGLGDRSPQVGNRLNRPKTSWVDRDGVSPKRTPLKRTLPKRTQKIGPS